MAPPPAGAALSAVAVAMAVGIFYHFNFGLTPYMEPLKDACGLNGPPKGQQPEFYKMGQPFLDALHCLLTPFFLDCVALPSGRFWVLKTLELATPVMSLLALEESRTSARGAVRWSLAVLALSQLLGISVALPAVWLTSWLLLSRPRVQGAFLPEGKTKTLVPAALGSILLTIPLTYASWLPASARPRMVVIFNLALPCLAALWQLAPPGRRPGDAAAARALRTVALIALVLHAASLVDILASFRGNPRAAWGALAAVARRESVAAMPANFMLWDFIGLLGSCLIFAVADDGAAAAVGLVASMLALGPGAAFALFLSQREERLSATAAKAPPRGGGGGGGAPAGAAAAAAGGGGASGAGGEGEKLE